MIGPTFVTAARGGDAAPELHGLRDRCSFALLRLLQRTDPLPRAVAALARRLGELEQVLLRLKRFTACWGSGEHVSAPGLPPLYTAKEKRRAATPEGPTTEVEVATFELRVCARCGLAYARDPLKGP